MRKYNIPIELGVYGAVKRGEHVARFYTHYKTGSGRWTKISHAKGFELRRLLDEKGVKYTEGNDAPRGGMLGNYVEFKLDKRNTFIKAMIEDVESSQANQQKQKHDRENRQEKPLTDEQSRRIREIGISHIKNMVNHLETADMYSTRKQLGLTYKQVREFCIKEMEAQNGQDI